MRISAKILIPNLLSLSLIAVALVYLLLSLSGDSRRLQESAHTVEETNRVATQLDQIERTVAVALLSYRYDRNPQHLDAIQAAETAHGQAIDDVRRTITTSTGERLLREYLQSRQGASEIRAELIGAVGRGDEGAIGRAYRRWSIKAQQARARLNDFIAFKMLVLDRLLDEVESRRGRTSRWVLFLTLFASGAIVASSLYYGRAIARPLVALTEVSKRIAHGEVETRIRPANRNDEVALLAEAFNRMADRLVSANAELERKVEERTAELGDANAALHANLLELRRMQESLLQAERLAAIGQMVTGLSHESRNALQRSLACLEMLAKRIRDNEQGLHLLNEARKAQTDLQQVYEGVREYARPLNLDRSPRNIAETWRHAWEQTALLREGRDATLVEDIRAADLQCALDPFRFVQVFRNLVENSLAACPDPVRITVHCTDGAADGPGGLRVVVTDNGPGLTPEEKERIFEPFFTTKTKGTGLGMSIVKRIVEAHGGRVSAESYLGQGLEIVIDIPREVSA